MQGKLIHAFLRPGVLAFSIITMRNLLLTIFLLSGLLATQHGNAQDPLPSWNEGPAKKAIVEFVRATTENGSANFVPAEERIATFDMDGTLMAEHPMYTQVMYYLESVPELVEKRPELKEAEPFKTVMTGDRASIDRLPYSDLRKISDAMLAGLSTEEYHADVKNWLEKAREPRWKRHYTELVYQPMTELLTFLRGKGYKTYIVTGSDQDFVRVFAEHVFGIPPEQVLGTIGETTYGYDSNGTPVLTKNPKILLDDNNGGKPAGIHMFIGRRPYFACGNSPGDQQMLEYTKAGKGNRLAMLVLHDDASREYAYGPAQGLPDTKVGVFSQVLYDMAFRQGWTVISMKNDWKRVFAFDK